VRRIYKRANPTTNNIASGGRKYHIGSEFIDTREKQSAPVKKMLSALNARCSFFTFWRVNGAEMESSKWLPSREREASLNQAAAAIDCSANARKRVIHNSRLTAIFSAFKSDSE
jgi:hypothetical protein